MRQFLFLIFRCRRLRQEVIWKILISRFSRFQDCYHQGKGLQGRHQAMGWAEADGVPGGSAGHWTDSQQSSLPRQVARVSLLQAVVGQRALDQLRWVTWHIIMAFKSVLFAPPLHNPTFFFSYRATQFFTEKSVARSKQKYNPNLSSLIKMLVGRWTEASCSVVIYLLKFQVYAFTPNYKFRTRFDDKILSRSPFVLNAFLPKYQMRSNATKRWSAWPNHKVVNTIFKRDYKFRKFSGHKWRSHRKLIAPTFHLNVLKSFIELFNDNSRHVCKKMRSLDGKTFDCHDCKLN